MLYLYQSNHLEQLSRILARTLIASPADPFQRETVVVQHPGMGRWLSLRLADELGVCANIGFSQPAGFIWQILEFLLPGVPQNNPFDPGVLPWAVLKQFERIRGLRGFGAVNAYLQGNGEAESFQLAQQIAACLDQYLVYRPDWVESWEHGERAVDGDGWQSELWRLLTDEHKDEHWAALQKRLFASARKGELNPHNLPQRVFLFALSSLSPGYLSLVELLAELTDVHLLLLNPCQQHWTDIVDQKDLAERELSGSSDGLYLEVGNPLLASLGAQGRDFLSLIHEIDPGAEDHFVDPGDESLLHRIQQDILDLREPGESSSFAFGSDDRSIRIHSCHSAMREVEVLHDQLLGMFDDNPGLQPSDVLVMTPDMDTYAPYVEAVFGAAEEHGRVPFSIADRATLAESPLAESFLKLLSLPSSRYDVNEMLSLLEVSSICARFGLTTDDIPRIAEWLEQAEVRWGKDASTREKLGLPPTDRNSWRSGLDRMLLGFAMPPGDELYQGLLPFEHVEGSAAQIVGGLSAFAQAVFELENLLAGHNTMEQWEAIVAQVIDLFYLPDDSDELKLQQVRETAAQIAGRAGSAGIARKFGIEMLNYQLGNLLDKPSVAGSFIGNGVSFCALTPMRSVPFKVICIIGMNDGQYPRDRRPPGFDLMEGRFRTGDRSRRGDDRYLFLETLISCREIFYLSYTGQDVRDNSAIPPSVLVSELCDYINRTASGQDGLEVCDMLTVRHPLQPFSTDYFRGDDELFSFDRGMCRAAAAGAEARRERPPLITQALSDRPESDRQVELIQLLEFFSSPARYLIKRQLGIVLESERGLLESRDPFSLDYFYHSDLLHQLVQFHREGLDTQQLLQREQAAGRFPHGRYGEQYFQQLNNQASQFAPQVESLDPGGVTESLDLDFQGSGLRLMGKIQDVGSCGIFGFSVKRVHDAQLLQLWIRHLALNLVVSGHQASTRWLDADGVMVFRPVKNADDYVNDLLQLYQEGQRAALHLFPKSSRAYAESRIGREHDPDKSLTAARSRWDGSEWSPGESQSPYYRLAFSGCDVMDAEFEKLSMRVYEPMLQHREVQ
jgi:exodeoxyribonuclease V gamma subunit